MIDAEKIYVEYKERVTRYVSGKINDPHEAEDLVSSVFLKIYAKAGSFDENKASLSTWIYTITRNTVTDYFRALRQFSQVPETLASDETADGRLLCREMLDSLADALCRLDERARDLIILHYYNEYTLKTIAEMMDISYSYAKLLHKNALQSLRGMLPTDSSSG